jgi:hypothetical protein
MSVGSFSAEIAAKSGPAIMRAAVIASDRGMSSSAWLQAADSVIAFRDEAFPRAPYVGDSRPSPCNLGRSRILAFQPMRQRETWAILFA